MARGKYRKRATLRATATAAARRKNAEHKLAREIEKAKTVEAQVLELDAVLVEIRALEDELAQMTRDEEEALRAEITGILSDICEVKVQVDQRRRSSRRKMNAMIGEGERLSVRQEQRQDIAIYEALAKEHGWDVTVTAGVYNRRDLDDEAIRRIQKARGLR